MKDVIVPKSDMVVEGPNTWDRRKGEPTEAYAWFLEFVQLGVMRSLFKLSAIDYLPEGLSTKPSVSKFKSWHRNWNWDGRSTDYDDELTANALSVYERKMEQIKMGVKTEEMLFAAKITALADKITKLVLDGNIPVKTTTKTQSDTVDDEGQKVRTTKSITTDFQALAMRVPAMYLAASELLRRANNMTKEKNELVVNEEFEQLDLGEVSIDELKQLERQITQTIGSQAQKHIA